MGIYNVVTKEDKILRQPCKPVPEVTPNVQKLLNNMLETMYANNGVGLAAPQVGISKRVIVVDVGEERGNGALKLVNPEIIAYSGTQNGPEGCLSCPNIYGDVIRHEKVTVKALDENGQPVEIQAEGFEARALQHEIDHLNGILFLDKATNIEIVENN